MKIGLSFTSIANAKINLATEATGLTFEKAKLQAQATWRNELGKINVQGTDRDSKLKFYTGLFHALLGRGTASDVNGSYPGMMVP
ncbi:glycoside hydrolase domain-containing protein [Mucilaginibacter antarcticus]|uniref:glycoside hydrolase domain-containing protein n=1 Tax=Mucilaginibacter antarcticus TaxID=1855725 RepID=UPI003634A898